VREQDKTFAQPGWADTDEPQPREEEPTCGRTRPSRESWRTWSSPSASVAPPAGAGTAPD